MQPFTHPFTDQREAGRQLAQRLLKYRGDPNVLVLAVSRAGALVAAGIVEIIDAPLDVFCVRAVAVPGYDELSMGTVARGVFRANRETIEAGAIPMQAFFDAASAEQEKLQRLEAFYRGGRDAPAIAGRTVIVVDEGLTEESMLPAAVDAVHRHGAAEILAAAPVATAAAAEELKGRASEFVSLYAIDRVTGLETWYAAPTDVDDAAVRDALHQAAERRESAHREEVR